MFNEFTFNHILGMLDNFRNVDYSKLTACFERLARTVSALDYDQLYADANNHAARTLYSSGTKNTYFYGHYTRTLMFTENHRINPGKLVPSSSHKLYTYLYDGSGHISCIIAKRQSAVTFCNVTDDSEVFLVYSNNSERPVPYELTAVKYSGSEIAAILKISLYPGIEYSAGIDEIEYSVCKDPASPEPDIDIFHIFIFNKEQKYQIIKETCINVKDETGESFLTYARDLDDGRHSFIVDQID